MERSYHKVLRVISGYDAQPGDVIDTTDWANARTLERLNYLQRHAGPPPASVVVVEETAEDEDAEEKKPQRQSIRPVKGAWK